MASLRETFGSDFMMNFSETIIRAFKKLNHEDKRARGCRRLSFQTFYVLCTQSLLLFIMMMMMMSLVKKCH